MTGYGQKYKAEFGSIRQNTIFSQFGLYIYQKGFVGSFTELLFSGEPVIQEWQDDDPKKPIRGCMLNASFITDSSGVQLTDFYSEDDLQFYCEYRCLDTDQLLFAGFLLQDDCAEIEVDFNHEIKLSFTDMLGTLKDVTLDQAAVIVGTLHTETGVDIQNLSFVHPNTIASFDSRVSVLKPGDVFTIYDGVNTYEYVCLNLTYETLYGWIIWCNDSISWSGTITWDFTYKIPYPLTGTIPLIDVIKLCLKSTYIDDIGLRSYVNIYPESTSGVEEIWQDTFVHAEDYFNGDNWENCYDILEKLMDRFNCSLMQVDGFWTIVRWAEIYNYAVPDNNNLRYHYWDYQFNYIAAAINYNNFIFYNGSDLETGVIKSVVRPKQYVLETMQYNTPQFLKNQDLNETGALINEYAIGGGNTVYEYELPYWTASVGGVVKFIRVVKDSNNNELERYLVTTNLSTPTDIVIEYTNIELSVSDRLNFTFSTKTSNSEPGPINLVFQIFINDGINPTYKINTDGSWATSGGFSYSIASGDNLNEWHSVNIQSLAIPFNCIVTLYLGYYSSSGGNETHFKDLSFSVSNSVNDFLIVSGHQNKDTQPKELKNNIDKEINVDNTPRSSISGCLFTNDFVGLIRQRTQRWLYPGGFVNYTSLGLGTTQEEMYQNYKPRTKYEGNLLYLLKGTGPYVFVNPLSVFMLNTNPNQYRFVPGKVAIDYKNNSVDITLYEIIDSANGFTNEINDYLNWAASNTFYDFKYLYDK